MITKSTSSRLRGIAYALAGFTFWCIGDSFMKLAAETGAPKPEVMAIASLSGMAMLFGFLALRGEIRRLKPKKYTNMLILSILFVISYACWLIALPRLPLADFYTIIFLTPLLVSLLAALFLHEALNWPKRLAIIAGFIGVVIAVNPVHLFDSGTGLTGRIVAFCGVFSFALQMLALRMMRKQETHESTAFYPRIGGIVLGIVGTVIMGSAALHTDSLVFSILTGASGSLGWMFMARAYQSAPAALVAPFHYSQIITGSVIGYLVWHDVPSLHLIIGAMIIIAAGIYVLRHARKEEISTEEPHS
jgi:drug/metabolite transporter (DMT)-like permease